MGSFHMIVGYFPTIFYKSVVIVSFLCCYTISFDCSPSCCEFDPVVPCLHCGYLYLWLISSKHIFLENLSYLKKQQEQAEAQANNIIKAFNSGNLFQLSGVSVAPAGHAWVQCLPYWAAILPPCCPCPGPCLCPCWASTSPGS